MNSNACATDASLPILALAMGDPAGISPELTAKLLGLEEIRAAARLVVFGDLRIFEAGARIAGIPRLLANEWGAKGVNINAIAPGYMATDNTAQLRADADRNKAILDRIPAGRWGEPSDLGGTAVFLASRASDYVNGAVIPVDGGWLAR